MAKCDEGYICEVCGKDVENIVQSDLYLRYVIGEIEPEVLHTFKERHIACNPTLGQFIVSDDFTPIHCAGAFSKTNLDDDYVRQQEDLVTRGWLRLRELQNNADVETAVINYPLPEVLDKNR